MIYACYRMGYLGKQTVHGFRGLGSTWANEAEHYKSDWIEMALAHQDEDEVRGAYNSALYLTPRRRMLQDWADSIFTAVNGATPGDVVKRSQNAHSAAALAGVGPFPSLPPADDRLPYWRRSTATGPRFISLRPAGK